jgi:hypothetical protein
MSVSEITNENIKKLDEYKYLDKKQYLKIKEGLIPEDKTNIQNLFTKIEKNDRSSIPYLFSVSINKLIKNSNTLVEKIDKLEKNYLMLNERANVSTRGILDSNVRINGIEKIIFKDKTENKDEPNSTSQKMGGKKSRKSRKNKRKTQKKKINR